MEKIDFLSTKFIPLVASWYLDNFSGKNTTIERCEEVLQKRLKTSELDICFLYFIDETPVGTVSVAANDILGHPDLTPCISNLFVVEEFRHNKIGQKLIEHAQKKLRELNFQKLYLYTTNPTIHSWYKKLGWRVIDEDCVFSTKIKIMQIDLYCKRKIKFLTFSQNSFYI